MMSSYLFIAGVVLLVIGIIVATTIKEDMSDKVKGDKRLVAAIFILVSVILFMAGFTLSAFSKLSPECVNSAAHETAGIENLIHVKTPTFVDNPFAEP